MCSMDPLFFLKIVNFSYFRKNQNIEFQESKTQKRKISNSSLVGVDIYRLLVFLYLHFRSKLRPWQIGELSPLFGQKSREVT